MDDQGSSSPAPTPGFSSTPEVEERYVQDVLNGRYTRLEGGARWSVAMAGAAALWIVGAYLVEARDLDTARQIAFAMAGVHLVAAVLLWTRENGPGFGQSGPKQKRGCIRVDGRLGPVLRDGERVLFEAPASGPYLSRIRWVVAVSQAMAGVLLAGLPMATALVDASGQSGFSTSLAIWTVVMTEIGALLVGRGAQTLFSVRPVLQFALTDQRLVAMTRPGFARSLRLTDLVHKPVVIERFEGGATVGFHLEKLASMGLFAPRGLWGLHQISVSEARAWAKAVMETRREP